MKALATRISSLTTLLFGLGLSVNAQAYWQLDSSAAATGSAVSGTAGDVGTVTLSGFYVSNASLGSNWTAGTLSPYAGGGLGMTTGTDNGAPYHALDNNENTESVLLSFSTSTVLSSIGLGYTGNGTVTNCASYCTSNTPTIGVDISLFRWVGVGTPTGAKALTSTAANTMTGWELVGNYGDMQYDTSNPYSLVNTTGKSSSYWLISAYNAGFNQSAGAQNLGTIETANDYFKLYAVTGTAAPTNKAPEPASLALAGLALAGLAGVRRRRAKLPA